MKAFQFSLEAVRTLRLRQENDALERYARALLVRQQALDAVEAASERIHAHWGEMRRHLSRRCSALQARQLQEHHGVLERRQQECVAALRAAERAVNAASQIMLLARQQREIVDGYRDKQWAKHQRLEAHEEQKINDEFSARRGSSLYSNFSTP
jgi:flagellar export protein FliJ